MKKFYFITVMLLAGMLTNAQNHSQVVKGTIIDKISEKPLAGASVRIEGTSLSSSADANGFFVLKEVPVVVLKSTSHLLAIKLLQSPKCW
jgi:hypothetical protein